MLHGDQGGAQHGLRQRSGVAGHEWGPAVPHIGWLESGVPGGQEENRGGKKLEPGCGGSPTVLGAGLCPVGAREPGRLFV